MKRFITNGCRLVSIDTDTFDTQNVHSSISTYIDYIYKIPEDGVFQHGNITLNVTKDDLVVVLYDNCGLKDDLKVFKLTDPIFLEGYKQRENHKNNEALRSKSDESEPCDNCYKIA